MDEQKRLEHWLAERQREDKREPTSLAELWRRADGLERMRIAGQLRALLTHHSDVPIDNGDKL